ncbi:VOC family protein [Paludibaculum fermentans]|uniref:VOC family protein n=1 Tax=Paludibaculum fermentans TaxID=1473598 RepID=A0A7S7NUA9_PALFE|nr:VOC family protein [Paludibaculum fermentans]QOY89369.1 VOC family protein [Paludibaculum fermentans]
MVNELIAAGFEFVDHVAIAVKQGELDAQVLKYKALGFTELHREEVYGKHQVREVLLQIGAGPNLIQLLEPLSPESPVAKQIEKSGGRGGFAHLAFRVKDINVAYAVMKEKGFNLTQEPGPGSRGTMIFFVHPKDFSYLIEVVQEGTTHA